MIREDVPIRPLDHVGEPQERRSVCKYSNVCIVRNARPRSYAHVKGTCVRQVLQGKDKAAQPNKLHSQLGSKAVALILVVQIGPPCCILSSAAQGGDINDVFAECCIAG